MRLRTFFFRSSRVGGLRSGWLARRLGVADMKELTLSEEDRAAMAGPNPPMFRTMGVETWHQGTSMDVKDVIPPQGADGGGAGSLGPVFPGPDRGAGASGRRGVHA